MKLRPILFQGPMVRALLAGTKTQTRRVVKPQPVANQRGKFNFTTFTDDEGIESYWQNYPFWGPVRCPYGQPGDRLWVRETWAVPHRYDGHGPSNIPVHDVRVHYAASEERGGLRWRPSIHMPRWASRITLEITGVRVERLQDISEADAIAEGIERGQGFPGWYRGPLPGDGAGLEQAGRDFKIPTAFPKLAYRALWDSINGPGSWDANPWVWVVEFRRTQP